MTADHARLRRQASALEEAEGLIDELKAKAISRGEFDLEMVALETSNPDLEVITDARMDPFGQGDRVTGELAQVREQIASKHRNNKGDAP
jgi:phage shock protein A